MKNAQMGLFCLPRDRTEHGGDLARSKRKVARPFRAKQLVHLVLRSSKAKGKLSFLNAKNATKVESVVKIQANRHFVKVYEFVNVGNHLHLKVRPYTKDGFRNFLRTATALIARAVTGAKKGKPFGIFWDALAYTRVLRTRAEEWTLRRYFAANSYEAEFGQMARETYLSENPLNRRARRAAPG